MLNFFKKNTDIKNRTFSRDSLFVLHNLRDIDYNRYLACLLSPSKYRILLAFLYNFNAELMNLRYVSNNPIVVDIRLQWWKDIFESSKEDTLPDSISPFAVELLSIIRQYNIPYWLFLDMVEAHFFDPFSGSIFDCKKFEIYSFKIASHLIYIAAMILDCKDCSSFLSVIKHAGIAQFIGQLISQLPIHCKKGYLYFPLDILEAVGLNRESFLSGQDRDRISLAIKIFAELGLENLLKARKDICYIPPDVFAAFIPVSITESILKNAQNNGFKIFSNSNEISRFMNQWYIFSSSIRKIF
ncbi:squalene/phytoene synthase family protein [Candidatus Liberibacter brunswickensis]|uniref:squalene/phytoene synthase family protein n=1 Tax=Candidatus Liberibacter brunswickensis TaxID=1968796 RepID=UPI002FE360C3